MAKKQAHSRVHTAKASVQIHDLTKAGTSIELEIFAEGEKLGRLVIGRGSVTWFIRNGRTPHKLAWGRFSEVMEGAA